MKTLDEFNASRRAFYTTSADESQPNGIACECGVELWDTSPMVTMTSDPPQKAVHCPECAIEAIGWLKTGEIDE